MVCSAFALDPVESKLFSSRRDGNTGDDSFGLAMAGSDRWLLVGETGNGEKGANAGAAYLFDANTGALKRKLLASDGAAGDFFGAALAVRGNRIVIGAPGKDGARGAAYAFDALTGRQLGKMLSSTAEANDELGAAVAIEGDVVAVSAPGDDANRGSIHVYSIAGLATSSDERFKCVSVPRLIGVGFGRRLDTDGRFLVTSAPSESGDRGSVHLFDLFNASQLLKITTGASTGDSLGHQVALSCGRIYASRPNASLERGAVNIYDFVTGSLIGTVSSPQPFAGGQFGFGMAVRENLLLVGQPEENSGGQGRLFAFDRDGQDGLQLKASDGKADDKLGSTVAIGGAASVFASADPGGNGIAYRFTKVLPPVYGTLAPGLRVGDMAPGAGAARFTRVSAATLGPDAEQDILFLGAAGRVSGVWDRITNTLRASVLNTFNVSPVPTGVEFIRGFGVPMIHDTGIAILPVSFTSTVVTATNPDALFGRSASALIPLVRLGAAFNTVPFGGSSTGTLASMAQVVQSSDTSGHRFAIAGRFRVGAGGVTPENDSVILVPDVLGNLDAADQEDRFVPGTGGPNRIGQISPRVAFSNRLYLYHAAVKNASVREGIFLGTFTPGPGPLGAQLAGQGDALSGLLLNRFLGETVSSDDEVAFRALVLGTTTTVANNEMIVSNRFSTLEKVFQKGSGIGSLLPDGTVVSRFLRFWAVSVDRVVALVQLRGPGVTQANDVALVAANELTNSFTLLLREGGVAPGCDGSVINTIQTAELSSADQTYFVVASLRGAVAGQDQALFVGNLADAPIGRVRQRQPRLELRKGSLFRTDFGNQAKITSIALGTRASDATGASEKGLPSAVSINKRAALILRFSDGSTQAVEMLLE